MATWEKENVSEEDTGHPAGLKRPCELGERGLWPCPYGCPGCGGSLDIVSNARAA